jgi:hypothetical protein
VISVGVDIQFPGSKNTSRANVEAVFAARWSQIGAQCRTKRNAPGEKPRVKRQTLDRAHSHSAQLVDHKQPNHMRRSLCYSEYVASAYKY